VFARPDCEDGGRGCPDWLCSIGKALKKKPVRKVSPEVGALGRIVPRSHHSQEKAGEQVSGTLHFAQGFADNARARTRIGQVRALGFRGS
jgi:hypothetical protein